tara:strand:+ start:1323 stop:2393 length:1071 start_codon:yes stop_codon:yes gene_type:complete
MKKKERNNDFSLSFLDIMACGLGGVIIIFLLLDNKPNSIITESKTNNEILIEEIESLSNSNLELSTANQQLELNIENEKNKLSTIDKQNETLEKKIKDIDKTSEEINKEVSQLKEKISKMPQEIIEDPISNDELFEENYIEGLRIVGKKICILLDSSSSMTDEKLLEIIKRKNLSDEEKKKGPKWKRSLDIVKWILARAPKESNIAVIRFSETAKYIAKESFQTKNKNDLKTIFLGLNNIIPNGPTNLLSALIQAAKFKPTNIYLITDGLPTFGGERFKSLNPFNKCDSIIGSSNKISGECRVKLFNQSIKYVSNNGAKIDIILLPVEGDPQASPEMWKWASDTGGILISPAKNWP